MKLPDVYFSDFLSNIQLTDADRREAQKGHRDLRSNLSTFDDLKPIIVATFLQGSYRRSTSIKPNGDKRSDVDVVVVTNLDESAYPLPSQAMELFQPFVEHHYSGKWHPQNRSIGIELDGVDLDLVVTSAPSQITKEAITRLAEDEDFVDNGVAEMPKRLLDMLESLFRDSQSGNWRNEPLRIPDRELAAWQSTHPLAQIVWTTEKNNQCNGNYLGVVKAIKWWQRRNVGPVPRPKGYPLEHIVGDCCPAGINSVQEGIVKTLDEIVARYGAAASARQVPHLRDRGVDQNVMLRIDGEQFARFYDAVSGIAYQAREAFRDEVDECTAIRIWRGILGPEFPEPPERCRDREDNGFPFTPRTRPSDPDPRRYA